MAQSLREATYPWTPPLNGGFTVLELPSSKEAIAWTARVAVIRSFEYSGLIQSMRKVTVTFKR
jgi:hypothetical protein